LRYSDKPKHENHTKVLKTDALENNMVQTLWTHVCKWKISTCWNYSRNGVGGIKENGGGGEFKYGIFDILKEIL
jgi:hypothetical protein